MQGLRVGVTGARKAAQLAAALERRGASTLVGPLVTTDQPAPDADIVRATDAVIAAEPAWLAASTGVGMRLWADVAGRHGRDTQLRRVLAAATCVARGAKAVGGVAALGRRPDHVTDEETDDAVADWLVAHAAAGDTVAVQLHGGEVAAFDPLGEAGIDVVTVRPYVAGRLPEDEARARALVRAITEGQLDIVTFTSPGAARNLYTLAAEMGEATDAALERALGDRVAVAVIGPVTAEVLRDRGVPIAVSPQPHRQGELVRAIERWAAARRSRGR